MPSPDHRFCTRLVWVALSLSLAGREGIAQAAPPPPPPGSIRVLGAGDIRLRVTSQGYLGRTAGAIVPLVTAQWPGASGVEYLSSIQLVVAAKNGNAIDPALVYRASAGSEWQPVTTDPADSIRTGYEGMPGGLRYVDDDDDGFLDEDFLDGRDDDFDGLVDEDHAALGDEMLSFVMRDDTSEAVNAAAPERHVPLGLRCSQRVWSYSTPGFRDFVVVEYTIRNVGESSLDSIYVGWRVDPGCGARDGWGDPGLGDILAPTMPSAILPLVLDPGDPRRQHPWDLALGLTLSPDSALCPRLNLPVRGFSVVDADGDGGQANGVASFLLVDHTVDPTGVVGPLRVGFNSFRPARSEVAVELGGLPVFDLDAWRVMSGAEHVDLETGSPTGETANEPGDYVALCSIGPYRQVDAGRTIRATIAFAVQPGTAAGVAAYPADLAAFTSGALGARELLVRHPALENGLRLHALHAGNNIVPGPGDTAPDRHGRETPLIAPPGMTLELADCRDVALGVTRVVTANGTVWFDLDCDYCTGVYDYPAGRGLLHRPWTLPASLLTDAPRTVRRPGSVVLAYPNPSSGNVRIAIEDVEPGAVSLSIADAAGRRVRTLRGTVAARGASVLTWDGSDDAGRLARPGIYFIRVESPHRPLASRVLLLPAGR